MSRSSPAPLLAALMALLLLLPSLYMLKNLTQEVEVVTTSPATESKLDQAAIKAQLEKANNEIIKLKATNDKLEKTSAADAPAAQSIHNHLDASKASESEAALMIEIEQLKQQLKAQSSSVSNEKKDLEPSRTNIDSKHNIDSIKKSESSSDSNWKLWHTMSPSEQQDSLERAFARAAPYGTMLQRSKSTGINAGYHHNLCRDGKKPLLFGKGGEHMICGPPPDHVVTNNNTIPAPSDNGRESSSSSCKFFSFGIRDDPSWDIHLSKEWKCRGFAGDPSIVHPSTSFMGV